MRLIGLAVILTVGLALAPLAAEGQQTEKVSRVGLLGSASPAPYAHLVGALRQGLNDLGYVEGKNLSFEYRWAEGKYERLPALATELVRLKLDVIVTQGSPAAIAAKNATQTIPIIIPAALDPVGAGLVASLARPGGNLTGLSVLAPELIGKRLELLKEVIPRMTRVAVLWNAANPANASVWKETQAAAGALGLLLQSQEVRGPQDLEGAFARTAKVRPDALLVLGDSLVNTYRQQIVAFATQKHLPSVFGLREWVMVGGLMSYGVDQADMWRRSAVYVDKILKGAKPGDLPVEQPTKFEFVINMKTAKALGLTIPQTVLLQADQIIE
jgi:putative ABC transport system substrate-binding protein